MHIYGVAWEHSPTGVPGQALSLRGFNGNSTGCAPSPCCCLMSGHRQVISPLHFWRCALFFFASFLCPTRIWNFLQRKSLPSPTAQVPPQSRTVAHLELWGIALQLLKEQNQHKFSAWSSCLVTWKQQNTTLPPAALSILIPNAPAKSSCSWSRGLTESG